MTDLAVIREIDPLARVAPQAKIGSFCVVGPNVTIGPNSVLARRVCIYGHTTIGSGNVFDTGCVIGASPQDLKYAGAVTILTIGHRNRFGQRVTVHAGTESGGYLTRIGDDNVLMDGCHVAHDCYVDDKTVLGRSVLLAGHIRVQTGAVIEDFAGFHHFTTMGRYGLVGHHTAVRRDVAPYTIFGGTEFDSAPPAVKGIHEAGIKKARLGGEVEKDLRKALAELFQDEAALQTKIETLMNLGVEGEAAELCEFCQRSLQGVFGRWRELFRNKLPPEAEQYLPPELKAEARRRLA